MTEILFWGQRSHSFSLSLNWFFTACVAPVTPKTKQKHVKTKLAYKPILFIMKCKECGVKKLSMRFPVQSSYSLS